MQRTVPFDNLDATKKDDDFILTDLIYYRCLIRYRRVARRAELLRTKDRAWDTLIQRKY